MKISLHIDADNAEEMMAALALFHGAHKEHLDSWVHEPKDDIVQYPDLDTKPEPTVSTGIADKIEESLQKREQAAPVQVQEEVPQQAAEPAPEKPKRGRKAKAPTVDETLQEALEEGKKQAAPATANGHDVSRQDLLDVFSEYVTKFGVSFGYGDISTLLQKTFGENVRKASDVPDTGLGKAYAAIKAALEENPFNRKRDYA